MSDTFLPGSGFDTYEQQDKVLVGLCGGTGCKAAVRILQQQGFAVMGAVVRLCTDDPVVDAAKEAAKALGIECITLNASELASQLAGQFAGIQGDALDAQSLGGFLGGIHNGVIGAQTHHSAHHRKALLL